MKLLSRNILSISGIEAITPRKRFKIQKVLPKTAQDQPILIGVSPDFMKINSLPERGSAEDATDGSTSTLNVSDCAFAAAENTNAAANSAGAKR